MKKILVALTMGLCITLNINAQDMITEKGYYYSPNGFVCYEGDIYTSDMKNMVKSCYPSLRDKDKKMDSPERGINIVQMSNHSSHKELIK